MQREMTLDEIDLAVAEKVMGWKRLPNLVGDETGVFHLFEQTTFRDPVAGNKIWQPTRNIEQAWSVVEHLRDEGIEFEINGLPWETVCRFFNKSRVYLAEDRDVKIAICGAALRAAGIDYINRSV